MEDRERFNYTHSETFTLIRYFTQHTADEKVYSFTTGKVKGMKDKTNDVNMAYRTINSETRFQWKDYNYILMESIKPQFQRLLSQRREFPGKLSLLTSRII